MELLNFFQYDFLLRALIAGSLLAVLAGVLGVFLVLRKLSLIGDGLAHVSFGAVALGLLLGIYPFYISVPITALAAFLIFRLGEKAKFYGDAAIGIVSAVGIAGGVIIASLAQGFNVDLFSYLFGSLLAISWSELYFLLALTVVSLIFIIYYYRPLFALAFDETAAKALGVKVKFLNTILLLLTALTVAAAVKAVGVMLVSALLILPAATALQLAKNFKATLLMAAGFAVLSVIFGLAASLTYNLPAGASIVMASFFLFIFSYLISYLRK
ncbi:MAG: metal ABC transporter permease [Patescibacteria group bacterium]|nr:metal ABC transporter permease [Patescibacteria group bacterium]